MRGTVDGTGPVEGEEEVRWKVRRQAWVDSIGRVAADRKAGADYAAPKCCSRGKKLLGGSEAWAVVG